MFTHQRCTINPNITGDALVVAISWLRLPSRPRPWRLGPVAKRQSTGDGTRLGEISIDRRKEPCLTAICRRFALAHKLARVAGRFSHEAKTASRGSRPQILPRLRIQIGRGSCPGAEAELRQRFIINKGLPTKPKGSRKRAYERTTAVLGHPYLWRLRSRELFPIGFGFVLIPLRRLKRQGRSFHPSD